MFKDGLSGKYFIKNQECTIKLVYHSLLKSHIGILVRDGFEGVIIIDCAHTGFVWIETKKRADAYAQFFNCHILWKHLDTHA